MAHSVFINEKNHIEVNLSGAIGLEDAKQLSESAIALKIELVSQKKPIKILYNASDVGSIDPRVYPFIVSMFKNAEPQKLAFFGGDGAARMRQQAFILISGLFDKAQIFATRAEAEDWLSED